ncbi:MAG TPA: site-specific integrase [Polyangiaceae bacterium]
MPKASKTGTRGLYWDDIEECFRIDFRWRDPRTGLTDRYRERFPQSVKKPAARRRTEEVLNLALSGKLRDRQAGPGSLAAAFDQYLTFIKTNLGERAHTDRKHHAKLLVHELGTRPLVDLSPLDVERYKSKRRAAKRAPRGKPNEQAKKVEEPKPISAGTINRELATFKHFVGKAGEWGWIDEAQAAKLRKVKLLKEPPGRVRWLTDAERTRLYAVLPPEFRLLVLADAVSGMRRTELVELKKDQVDRKRKVITLDKTKSNRTRHVPINDQLDAVLKEAMAASGDGPYVFHSSRGLPYTPSGVSSFFRKLVERAGIEDFHLHDLRHDFATQVRRAGFGLDVIQKLLGHSTLAMAQRYAHLGDVELQQAVDAIAPALPTKIQKVAKTPRKTA